MSEWNQHDQDDNPFADPSVQKASTVGGGKQNTTDTTKTTGDEVPEWLATSSTSKAPAPAPSSSAPKPTTTTTNNNTNTPANPYEAPPPSANNNNNNNNTTTTTTNNNNTPGHAEEPSQNVILTIRMANLMLSAAMITNAVITLITLTGLTTGVLCIYTVAFSLMICCYECQIKQIIKLMAGNFGFIYNAKSRILFFLFVGIICFSLGTWGKILGTCMLANALFQTFIICKYPGFASMTVITADELALQYAKANPDLVARGAKAGMKYAKDNPEVAKAAMKNGEQWA